MNFKLRQFREAAGMTQMQLATKTGKSLRTIQSWESGLSLPNAETTWNLCIIFKTEPNELLGWYDEHPEDRKKGSAPPLNRDESILLADYRSCSPPRRRRAAEAVRDQRVLSEELEASSPASDGMVA